MKETKELNRLAGKLVNAGFEIAEDKKVDFSDLPKVFDPLMAGQSGVDGIGETTGELAAASNAAMDEATEAFAAELQSGNMSAEDKYDIAMAYAGVQSARRMIARTARRQTLEQVAQAMNNQPQIASGEPWTADRLEAMLSD